jgi:hypothetical protein
MQSTRSAHDRPARRMNLGSWPGIAPAAARDGALANPNSSNPVRNRRFLLLRHSGGVHQEESTLGALRTWSPRSVDNGQDRKLVILFPHQDGPDFPQYTTW